jgi:hypothetical protein
MRKTVVAAVNGQPLPRMHQRNFVKPRNRHLGPLAAAADDTRCSVALTLLTAGLAR